jgi:hypothetical protein
MRLRINMHLFTRGMEVLDATVSELEALLAEEVTGKCGDILMKHQ